MLERLRRGQLDCIIQVQMLGEGFDHPRLSVAAIFRPFRSLAPYIQFVGRVMRVIIQDAPDNPDNRGYIVSHVGLNNEERWEEFRELDLEDQALLQEWLRGQGGNGDDGEGEGGPRPRRFDTAELVNNEIIGQFIDREFLDPEDDRVLDELLAKPVVPGLTVGDLVSREQLRDQLRQRRDAAPAEVPTPIPVSPQRRRQAARDRLAGRTGPVVNRVLTDLRLSRPGRDVARAGLGAGGGSNVEAVTSTSQPRDQGLQRRQGPGRPHGRRSGSGLREPRPTRRTRSGTGSALHSEGPADAQNPQHPRSLQRLR